MISKKIQHSVPNAIRVLRAVATENLACSLTLQQLRVLKYIAEGQGCTSIADSLRVSLAAVSKMVDALVNNDLCKKKAGKDKRTHLLLLTPKGKKFMKQLSEYVDDVLNEAIKGLTSEQKTDLLNGLSVLDEIMERVKGR